MYLLGKVETCPFCNQDEVRRFQVYYPMSKDAKYIVECRACGRSTGRWDTLEEAIEEWEGEKD